MLLSGCMANAGEEYLALPELPTQYNALQNALDNLADQNGYVTALAGAHRQPVQMIDLDADGTEEVIVFTTDSAGLCQVHVLREREEGYSVVNSVSGESADLYEVRYPTLTSDGLRGIAIAWGQAQDEFRGVTVIGMKPDSLPEVMTFSCQSYLFEDTDRDGADEIWYADRGGTQWIRSRLQRYEYDETDGFYPTGRLSLAAEAKYTIHLRAGLCDDGTPAVFCRQLYGGTKPTGYRPGGGIGFRFVFHDTGTGSQCRCHIAPQYCILYGYQRRRCAGDPGGY